MKYQKSFTALMLLIFFSTGLFATGTDGMPQPTLRELNETMRLKLDLSQEQMQSVLELNQEYWYSRKYIMNNPEKIGKNTAVLACWDRWVQQLSQRLTADQMEVFMLWQREVDILSEKPY